MEIDDNPSPNTLSDQYGGQPIVTLRLLGVSDLDLPLVKQEFQFAEETVDLSGHDPRWAKSGAGVFAMISRATKAQVNLDANQMKIYLSGPRPQVTLAMEALEVHLGYAPIEKDMDFLERELADYRTKLRKLEAYAGFGSD